MCLCVCVSYDLLPLLVLMAIAAHTFTGTAFVNGVHEKRFTMWRNVAAATDDESQEQHNLKYFSQFRFFPSVCH